VAEERYQNREPRDEDLLMIDQLNGAIHRLEASVKQLNVSSLYSAILLIFFQIIAKIRNLYI